MRARCNSWICLYCIRFHDLRHSAASLLLTVGVHPKIVQEILGHTQISMTMDIYSHVLPSIFLGDTVYFAQCF